LDRRGRGIGAKGDKGRGIKREKGVS